MRKVWIYKRPGKPGYWVGWYEGTKRKAKALPTKTLAEHYQRILYTKLNSDVFTSPIASPWSDMVERYRRHKVAQGLRKKSIWEAMHTLELFEQAQPVETSAQFTRYAVDMFIAERQAYVSRHTVNKDISNLRAFARWAADNHYIEPMRLSKLKVDQRQPHALSPDQVKRLLDAVKPDPRWHMRVLLAVATGLRREDIESIRPKDFDLDKSVVATYSRKTRKRMAERPLPRAILPAVRRYLDSIPPGQTRLFSDTHTHKKWKRFREKAGLPQLRFHDLRATFASLLAQRGVGQSVVQTLLEHSTPTLTHQVYTDVSPALESAVNTLPTDGWV